MALDQQSDKLYTYTPSDALVRDSVRLIYWFSQSIYHDQKERVKATWKQNADPSLLEIVQYVEIGVEYYEEESDMNRARAVTAFIEDDVGTRSEFAKVKQEHDPAEIVRVADVIAHMIQKTFKEDKFYNEQIKPEPRVDGATLEAQEIGHEHLARAIEKGIRVPGFRSGKYNELTHDVQFALNNNQ